MGGIPREPNFLEEKRLWKKGYRIVIGVDEVGRGAFAGPVTAAAVSFKPSRRSGIVLNSIPDRRRWKEGKDGLEGYLREIGVNDSKVLRPKKREILTREIKKLAFKFAVASASVGEINRLGIKKATERAFRRVVRTIRDHRNFHLGGVPSLRPTIRGGSTLRPHLGGGTCQPALYQNGAGPATIRGVFDPGSEIFVLSDAFHIKYLKGIGLKNQKAIKKGDKKSLSIAAASILAKVHRDNLMRKLSHCHRYRKYRWAKNKGYGTYEHRKAILRYGLTGLHRKAFVAKTLLERQA